jgi:hypothetical protein
LRREENSPLPATNLKPRALLPPVVAHRPPPAITAHGPRIHDAPPPLTGTFRVGNFHHTLARLACPHGPCHRGSSVQAVAVSSRSAARRELVTKHDRRCLAASYAPVAALGWTDPLCDHQRVRAAQPSLGSRCGTCSITSARAQAQGRALYGGMINLVSSTSSPSTTWWTWTTPHTGYGSMWRGLAT